MTQMTGRVSPTGIRKTDRGLEIDGYPDATQIVALQSKIGERLAALRLHQSTLTTCEAAMQKLGAVAESNIIVSETMLTGIVVGYFSCFGDNNAGHSLSHNRVFKRMPDALDCFRYWKALRDRLFVHNESRFTESKSGVVLGPDGQVQDILSFQATVAITSDQEHLQLLYNLIDHTLKHVLSEIDTVLSRAFAEVESMKPSERKALPPLIYDKPTPESVTVTRTWK